MPTEQVLVYYLDGIRVVNRAPGKHTFAALGARLAQPNSAQPDEADMEAPTALSLPVMTVQEEAPTTVAIGAKAETEAGRQPSFKYSTT